MIAMLTRLLREQSGTITSAYGVWAAIALVYGVFAFNAVTASRTLVL